MLIIYRHAYRPAKVHLALLARLLTWLYRVIVKPSTVEDIDVVEIYF